MVAFRFENTDIMSRDASNDNHLGDIRFRALLNPKDWRALPEAVKTRFAKRVGPGESVVYQGYVRHTKMNLAGKLLANLLCMVGAPLPLDLDNQDRAAIVTVTEDEKGRGQFWTRQYGRKTGFPQIIHSAKRFDGPTGLEEHIGFGIGMTLKLEVKSGALLFKSDRYFWNLLGQRLYLPQWLTPGALTVGHHDIGNGRFEFTLGLTHPLWGHLVDQSVMFEDAK